MKKFLTVALLTVFTVSTLPVTSLVKAAGSSAPSVSISAPSQGVVKQGGSVSYTVSVENAETFNLTTSDIGIAGNGVTLTKSVSGTGDTRTVTLSNIQGPVGKKVSIAVRAGVATNENGASGQTPKSIAFAIDAGTTSGDNSTSGDNTGDNNYSDNTGSSTIVPDAPYKDTVIPGITVYGPTPSTVKVGQSVVYKVAYTDNVGLAKIDLTASDVKLHGFTANISISGTGYGRTITLTNVQGTLGYPKYISINPGTAVDKSDNKDIGITASNAFTLIANTDDNNNNEDNKDTQAPKISVSAPRPSQIKNGETVKYVVTYTDDVKVTNVSLSESDITLHGFTADIKITGTGSIRVITLSNVQGTVGNGKYISIKAGTASDAEGNKAGSVDKTEAFAIVASDSNNNNSNNTSENNKPSDWVTNPNTGR